MNTVHQKTLNDSRRMRPFQRRMLVTALFCGITFVGGNHAFAGRGDMEVGTYKGQWAGYDVEYEVTRKKADRWVFYGYIYLPRTGQYDKIRIEQFRDNSLKITRYLTGAHQGLRQVLRTNGPSLYRKQGGLYSQFYGSTSGPGAQNNAGDLWKKEK